MYKKQYISYTPLYVSLKIIIYFIYIRSYLIYVILIDYYGKYLSKYEVSTVVALATKGEYESIYLSIYMYKIR
jgi:hypothetical protein